MCIQSDSRLPEIVVRETAAPLVLPAGDAGSELRPQSAGSSEDRPPHRTKPRPPPSRYGPNRSRSAACARIKVQSNRPCTRTSRMSILRGEEDLAVVAQQVARRHGTLRTGGSRYTCTNVDSDGAMFRRWSGGSEGPGVNSRAVPWLP